MVDVQLSSAILAVVSVFHAAIENVKTLRNHSPRGVKNERTMMEKWLQETLENSEYQITQRFSQYARELGESFAAGDGMYTFFRRWMDRADVQPQISLRPIWFVSPFLCNPALFVPSRSPWRATNMTSTCPTCKRKHFSRGRTLWMPWMPCVTDCYTHPPSPVLQALAPIPSSENRPSTLWLRTSHPKLYRPGIRRLAGHC
jgi:hypothetical protein